MVLIPRPDQPEISETGKFSSSNWRQIQLKTVSRTPRRPSHRENASADALPRTTGRCSTDHVTQGIV